MRLRGSGSKICTEELKLRLLKFFFGLRLTASLQLTVKEGFHYQFHGTGNLFPVIRNVCLNYS